MPHLSSLSPSRGAQHSLHTPLRTRIEDGSFPRAAWNVASSAFDQLTLLVLKTGRVVLLAALCVFGPRPFIEFSSGAWTAFCKEWAQ